MNLSEFKAWFEGFTEDMDGEPNAKQWKRIKKRVSEITSDPTPWPIFVDRYRPYIERWWCGSSFTVSSTSGQFAGNNAIQSLASAKGEALQSFNSTAAFEDLGRAEWQQISAA